MRDKPLFNQSRQRINSPSGIWIFNHKRFVLLWSFFIIAISSAPLIYGYCHTPSEWHFMGYTANPEDTNQYLAWIEQARRGHWLFENPYAIESHRRIFFHPLFLILGKLAAAFDLSNITVYQACRVLSGFFMLLVCYRFICYFFKDKNTQFLSFLIVSTSGGLCWLNWFDPNWGSRGSFLFSSTFRPAISTFWSLYLYPLFSLSIILLLLCLLSFQKFMQSEKYLFSIYSGLFLLLLVQLHPFDMLIPVGVLFLQIVLLSIKQGHIKWKWIIGYVLMCIIVSPYIAYLKFILMKDPVFNHWSQMAVWPPSFIEYIFMYGFLWIFAGFAIPALIRNISIKTAFLLSWLILIPIMVCLPIKPPNIATRLIEGYHVLLGMLTAMALCKVISKIRVMVCCKNLLMVGILVSLSLGNAWILIRDMKVINQVPVDYYMHEEIKQGMDWLKEKTHPDDAVLAYEIMGLLIPANTGNRVFFGHLAQTLNYFEKKGMVERYFSDKPSESERNNFLRSWQISYVFYSPIERYLGTYNPDNSLCLKSVFKNRLITIYKFDKSAL